jgi:hypothetical protein
MQALPGWDSTPLTTIGEAVALVHAAYLPTLLATPDFSLQL